MGTYRELIWQSTLEPGLPRRARGGCRYRAYIPDMLASHDLLLSGGVMADVAEAELALSQLTSATSHLVGIEAFARFLLRAEAVGSSKIEGLELSPHRLARAESVRRLGGNPDDPTAMEVLANVDAMQRAIDDVASRRVLDRSAITDIHETLMARSPRPEIAGRIRDGQNWIGGNDHNPCGAEFVPPPPELVPGLVDDLVAYMDEDTHSPIVQAAIAHAQFETIHPFADGNGRTGRALIHVVLRRRGLTPDVVPPVSMVLATWADRYVRGLSDFRHTHAPGSEQSGERMSSWIETFAAACLRACDDVAWVAQRLNEIEESWRERLAPVRAGSALDVLLRRLPGTPVITVESAAELTGGSFQRANVAIGRLVEAGILEQRSAGRRNRVFEAGAVLDALTDVERRLASASGDTRDSPPVRPTPYRRQAPS